MRIVIFDTSTPKPYDNELVKRESIGGTEATVVRVAEALARNGHEVTVAQHCRSVAQVSENNVQYWGFNKLDQLKNVNVMIGLRCGIGLAYAEKQWPNAKRIMWLHDLPSRNLIGDLVLAMDLNAKVYCVSNYHAGTVRDFALRMIEKTKDLVIDYVYNPVCVPQFGDVPTDADKLIFFSSPHKGLRHTLENFHDLRIDHPRFRLYIANPGYYKDLASLDPLLPVRLKDENVFQLGELSHDEVCKEVASSFAVYHSNWIFPETFGLVHAEANALGVPVITHPLGANMEILKQEKSQLVNCRASELVNDRLMQWSIEGRPKVKADPRFSIEEVTKKWQTILHE